MARNFVAVCVVCLLCAEHLPCKTHIDASIEDQDQEQYTLKHVDQDQIVIGANTAVWDQARTPISHPRRKRHEIHLQSESDLPKSLASSKTTKYLNEVLKQYGNGQEGTMNLQGFESLVEKLGLTNLFVFDDQNTNKTNCISPKGFIEVLSSDVDTSASRRLGKREVGASGRTLATSPNQLFDSKGRPGTTGSGDDDSSAPKRDLTLNSSSGQNDVNRALEITSNTLVDICPVFLYYLSSGDKRDLKCIEVADLAESIDQHSHDHYLEQEDRFLVWIYASASVLGVSLCGMLGFAVIPCMDKAFYNNMLQFLVALAVGTLAGDALLHLLPHAMLLSIETAAPGAAHTSMTLKGLVAVLGVIAFFAIERGLTIIAEWRKKRQKAKQLPGRVRVMRDPESVSLNISEKQCKNKYSSYPYCYDEIAMDTKDDHHHHHQQNVNHPSHNSERKSRPASTSFSAPCIGSSGPYKPNTVLPVVGKSQDNNLPFDHSQLNHHDIEGVSKFNGNGTHMIPSVDRMNSTSSNNNNITSADNTISTTLEDGISIESSRMLKPIKNEESFTVILREHESKHHGHSHTHGHVHSPPGSLSAVAWMVVMGDGLHNFTDGMAIGAAFSNNIAGGFSTAIAVFCHELPHELGDFAVLLKAGMSARKAVYYNFLSSILSFLGMVLGICIGDTPEASAWIFAVAAGLFIYIALVDMVPELTSSHREHCAGSATLLQVAGMCVGLVIMLLIALNEEDLKSLFTDNKQHHHHHHHR